MNSKSNAIKLSDISLDYNLYQKPIDRVKEALHPFRKEYHKIHSVLKNISLEVGWGETVGIVGRNGCGKSTLLQVVCGILPTSSGFSECHGRISPILELGAGFNPEFTGRENIFLKCSILGMSRDNIFQKIDSIIDFADIGEYIDQPTKTFSSGMNTRLAFSIAISVDPDILIVDEALSVGDAAFQRKCYSRIKAIQEKGATILFVSHSAGAIVELCDWAVLLEQGEMLYRGEPKEVIAKYHKLLFAPKESVVKIRQEIRDQVNLEKKQESQDKAPPPLKIGIEKAKPLLHAPKQNSDGFNPHLKPASSHWYESNGAEIMSPSITNIKGKKVNLLIRNNSYFFCYNVRFNKDAFKIRFGTSIKTIQGFDLGGFGRALNDSRFDFIQAGTEVEVKLKFTCNLLPNTYFLNAGVLGILDDNDVYLHRVIDVVMFEVQHEPGICGTGFVDFGFTPTITSG